MKITPDRNLAETDKMEKGVSCWYEIAQTNTVIDLTFLSEFTEPKLEAIQSVLAEYHYATDWWEVERAQLETLLYEVTQVRQIPSHPETI